VVDNVSTNRRSEIMAAVRSKHTAPEILVRKAAHRLGLRFRLHRRDLPGRPDLVLPKWNTVIFVNGCFWHRHPGCKRCKRTTVPKSNIRFWKRKFRENVQRDVRNCERLGDLGWKTAVLWQCEIATLEGAMRLLKRRFRKIVGKQSAISKKRSPR
jgi:DNA mismatch endonuclease, patch repair protein